MKLLSVFLMITQVLSVPRLEPYDEYGCCVSCGYTYCDTLLECVRPWEIECPDSITLRVINPPKAELINPFVRKDNNFILDTNNEVSGN